MTTTLSPQMKKMLKITGIIFAIIFGWYVAKKMLFMVLISHYQPPPVTISETVVAPKIWQDYLTSVGSLTAVNGVDVSAEASGIVKEIRFESGQTVKQGDVLVVLDTSVEQSELENNQAKLKLSQLSYDRDKTLLKRNAISQSVVDGDLANLQQAQAGVDEAQAHISQKTITAPFSGKIGIRQINLGQYVAAGTTMVTLQSLDPLYVRFNLPEQYVSDLYLQQPVTVTINSDATGSQNIQGVITAIDSKVDQTTRNILVQATIPNPNQTLYPGMFASVKVALRDKNNVLVLPQTAVSYSLHGDSVFVIRAEGKKKHPILHAYREYVKVGERRDDEVSITSGIKPGDQIATSGQIKLQNGTQVAIDNSVELGS